MAGKVLMHLYGRTSSGEVVHRAVIDNARGLSLTVLSFGGVIQQLSVPDRSGANDNVVLGFNTLRSYEQESPYFGAIIGRYANRIRDGVFKLDGVTYQVGVNDPFGSVHGGAVGFDKRIWSMQPLASPRVGVQLAHLSPHGEEGFPGALAVTVEYSVSTTDNIIRVDYAATTDRPTVVNLTNHSYFNLTGEGSGTALKHELEVAADHYLPVDTTLIPVGTPASVARTPFDFRSPRVVGERIRDGHEQLQLGRGYDHNFVLTRGTQGEIEFAARLIDPRSGRVLEVWTTEPGLDVYSGNFLDGGLVGASGRTYRQGDAIALEPEHFTDSPNNPTFPSTTLRPGDTYRSATEYRFSVVD